MDSNALVGGDYEVFLSFRGKDTRQGFTDVLYDYMTMADIRVFRDDDELGIGDNIASILEAIGTSKICIPIFSPKFAESKWCLREVTRMVELKKKIVPVFYKVSVDDVKLKDKSVYVDDLRKLQQKQRVDPVQIDKWKDALREAASNKGRELGDKSYTKFCKELVNEVLSKLGPRKRLDIDHFVGDTNKAEAIKLLGMGLSSQDVVYLGIYGMGGIGKTTIAKLIYNEFLSNFEYCGFLPDIREFSSHKGVDSLPAYLYENLQPKSITPFSQPDQIPVLFKNKKVLLILDDVDSCDQIKKIAFEPSWFGSGSRIMLTSRNKRVFEDYKAEYRCDIQHLEMKELQHAWSLELFSRCAFGKSSPPSSYQDLSKRVVAYARGLPLAITVIAKYLRNEKEEVWEEIIERLKKTLPKEVKVRLMISYESLENEQKKIFLDIACLFNHSLYSESSHIFYMWQACGLYPRWSLAVLQSRSLVKVVKDTFDDQFYLQIHDQLRDLGKDIVIARSGEDLTKQSRLWKNNEVMEVLKCKEKQKYMIEAINLNVTESFYEHMHSDMVFTDEEFVSFDNLRYLVLNYGSKIIGDFSNLFPKLRWLQCGDILEVRNLAPSNLVILDLSESNVDENWDGWSQILVLKHLKALDLSLCLRLRRTPVFPREMRLERLDLSECKLLEYIDTSLGRLQRLTKLNLRGCSKLKNLPTSCGELHALRELYVTGTSITSLPDSIGGLEKLEQLNLDGSILVELPQSLGNMISLRELTLGGSSLTSLPDSIKRLGKLEILDLSFGQLQEFPKLPSSLKVLRIGCGGLNNVPDLSNLQDLTSLMLFGARFNLLGSNGLQDLNIGLLSLSRLVALTLVKCEVITNIPGIGKLQSLTSLTIRRCGSLVSLVNLDKLIDLRTLWLIHCPRLAGIPGVGKLRRLTELTVRDCDSLLMLDDISGLEELKQLHLVGCPKLTKIPGLVNLKRLRLLDVDGCHSTEILGAASLLEKLHGVNVLGMPNWDMNSLDEIPDPRESVAQLLENLAGEVEGNSCDNTQIRHVGGLATDQMRELEEQ